MHPRVYITPTQIITTKLQQVTSWPFQFPKTSQENIWASLVQSQMHWNFHSPTQWGWGDARYLSHIWARSCCQKRCASFPWVRKDSSNAKNKVCESVKSITSITCFCSTSRVTDCVTAGWTPPLHEAWACSSEISIDGRRDVSTLPLHQTFPVAGAGGRTSSSEPITEKISALNVTCFKEEGN